MDIHEMADGLRRRLLEEGAATPESCGSLSRGEIMALCDKRVIEIYITRPGVCKGPMITYDDALLIISMSGSVEEFYDELSIIARDILEGRRSCADISK